MTRATRMAQEAYRIALAAAELEAAHEEAIKFDAARTERIRHRETYEAALPILAEWFPGVEWAYQAAGDYDRDTILQETTADWSDPLKLKVTRWLKDMNEPEAGYRVEIEIGEYRQDTSMPGYSYFAGSQVKSAADVGRWLAAH